MTWVKVDDSFPRHPKVLPLPASAKWAYVEALCYCGQYLTDGLVPVGIIPAKDAGRLVEAGLLEPCITGGFLVHDYLEYNPTRAKVLSERRRDSERKSRRNPSGTPPESDRPGPARPDPSPEAPKAKAAEAVHDTNPNQPTHDQLDLARKLSETWGQALEPPAIVKLNKAHGRRNVENALRSLRGFPPEEAVRKLYAYVAQIAADQAGAA